MKGATMKEAFEKIKERLEKLLGDTNFEKATQEVNESFYDGLAYAYGEALSIVSEVEAEFGKDINVRGNGWIPCSERLPEKSGRVLVSYESINDEIAVSETSYDYKRKTFWISPCVIAWMPLPSPYKPTND